LGSSTQPGAGGLVFDAMTRRDPSVSSRHSIIDVDSPEVMSASSPDRTLTICAEPYTFGCPVIETSVSLLDFHSSSVVSGWLSWTTTRPYVFVS
jgi:hypothetical protein